MRQQPFAGRCGGCGVHLAPDVSECHECGWRPRAARQVTRPPSAPAPTLFCQHRHEGQRCQLPAVTSDEVRGPNKWCWLHGSVSAREPGARQSAIYEKIGDPGARQELVEARKRDVRDGYLEQVYLDHPEWRKKPGESGPDFVARMRGVARELYARGRHGN